MAIFTQGIIVTRAIRTAGSFAFEERSEAKASIDLERGENGMMAETRHRVILPFSYEIPDGVALQCSFLSEQS
jgi:hypothetical protein